MFHRDIFFFFFFFFLLLLLLLLLFLLSSSSSSSSSAFQDCPQTTSLTVLMNVVVCNRSILALVQAWIFVASAVSVLPCIGGQECRTCSELCGPVSHGQLTVCDRHGDYNYKNGQQMQHFSTLRARFPTTVEHTVFGRIVVQALYVPKEQSSGLQSRKQRDELHHCCDNYEL